VNKVSVRNANNPMPTGHGEAGTKLLSSFEDGHYSSRETVTEKQRPRNRDREIVTEKQVTGADYGPRGCMPIQYNWCFCNESERQVMIPRLVEGGCFS